MAQQSCTSFLETFVLPLVAGGEMHVGKPLRPADLERMEGELAHASVPLVAIDDARTEVLSELVVSPPALVFDRDELYLAAALHNLLFLAHPDAEGFGASTTGRIRVLAAAQAFASQPRSHNRRRVLARHGLLHNLFDLKRRDLRLSWWTGSATFIGQEAPTRLTRWPTIRRVQEDEEIVGVQELLGSSEVSPVVASLLRRSPLTQLLSDYPKGPALHWEETVFLLQEPELVRSIAYRALQGSSSSAVVAVPARFSAAFEQMLERTPSESAIRCVAAFLVYLNVLIALSEGALREESPVLAATLSGSQRPRGLSTLFALPNALERLDPKLAKPPGLDDNPLLHRRWLVHRQQVRDQLGSGVVDSLAGRLGRHLSGVLESPEPSPEQPSHEDVLEETKGH